MTKENITGERRRSEAAKEIKTIHPEETMTTEEMTEEIIGKETMIEAIGGRGGTDTMTKMIEKKTNKRSFYQSNL